MLEGVDVLWRPICFIYEVEFLSNSLQQLGNTAIKLYLSVGPYLTFPNDCKISSLWIRRRQHSIKLRPSQGAQCDITCRCSTISMAAGAIANSDMLNNLLRDGISPYSVWRTISGCSLLGVLSLFRSVVLGGHAELPTALIHIIYIR